MLGRQSPQGELFRPDNIFRDHVGRNTFYEYLSNARGRQFRDEDFAGMYGERGRPSVPPSQLCVALLLQAREGVSDDEAIQRSAYDLRWKVALGLDLEDKLCAKSTLQLFRAKLILHESYQAIFQASVDECRKQGLLRRQKLEVAIDTTPILGRGAVKDTFNLISDQIRHLMTEIASLKGYEVADLVAEHGLGRHFASSFKGQFDLDWDDAEQKRAVVGQLVADARVALELAKAALRGYASDAEQTRALRAAQGLLADLLLQDIDEEPEDDKGPQVRRGTASDRIVSTTDPEMRHGRKSSSKRFDGYKAFVAVDTKAGVVLSTDVHAANKHDGEGAGDLVKRAGEAADQDVERVLGDTAYGSSGTRQEIAEATNGAEVVVKVPPATSRKGTEFTVEDFDIDLEDGVATCPQSKKSIRYERPKGTTAHRFTFSQTDCNDCPVRSKCTTAKTVARKITVSEGYDELRRLRKRQRTKSFKRTYRRRTKVEHRIGRLVQLGARQARYFGRAKVAFQICMIAAIANIVLACAGASRRRSTASGGAISALVILWSVVWFFCGTSGFLRSAPRFAWSGIRNCVAAIRARTVELLADRPSFSRATDARTTHLEMAFSRPAF
jgi:transposase